MTVLTKAEARAFLTQDDLRALEVDIENNKIVASLSEPTGTPMVIVRNKEIAFFDILELVGSV